MKTVYKIFLLILGITIITPCFCQLSGPSTLCSGVAGTYRSSTTPDNVSYKITWSYTGSPTVTTVNSSTKSISWTSNGSVSITEYEKSGTGKWVDIGTTTINVSIKSPGGITSLSSIQCPGSSVSLRNSNPAGIGTSFSWQSSPSGQNSWTTFATATSGNSTANPVINQKTDYRLLLNDCGTVASNVVTVDVFGSLTGAGSISGTQTICYNTTPTTLTSTSNPTTANNGPYSFQWQSRPSGGSWSNIAGAISSTYSPGPLTQTTDFQRIAQWGCNTGVTMASNTVTVTVIPAANAGTLSVSPSVLCNAGTVTLSDPGISGSVIYWQARYSEDSGTTFTSWTTFYTSASPATQSYSVSAGTVDRFYQFQVVAQNSSCTPVTSNLASVIVSSNNAGTPSTPLVEAYGVASGSFNISGYTGVFQKWQLSTNGGSSWTDIANTTPTFSYVNITTNTQYRALINNGSCVGIPSPAVSIKIYNVPSFTSSGPPVVALGGTVPLQAGSAYATYQWIRNGTDIAGATSSSYSVTQPGNYQLRVTGSATAPSATTGVYTVYALGYQPDNTVNMEVTTTVRKPGVNASTNLYTLQPAEYAQSISYTDELMRPKWNVAIGQSPLQKDMVQPFAYDTLNPVSYLPYADDSLNGYKKNKALKWSNAYANSDQYNFYQAIASKVDTSKYPFAKAVMENSALGRALEAGAPGYSWQPGKGHSVLSEYHTNAANDVYTWTVNGPGSYYAANTLMTAHATDENGNKVITYTDKLGRTVLKRVQLDETISGTTVNWLETYYVYDVNGNLALQIPPKAVAKIKSGTAWSAAFRDQWCFVYTYDVRQRLVEKKTPDAQPIYYGYDPLDRLVLVQDGNLRLNKQWLFVKYDIKGRPVMNGIYTNTTYTTRPALQQNVLDGLYASGVWYEDRGTALHGYTNQSFPTANSDASVVQVWTVNYYDTYDFDYNGTDDYSYTAQGIAGEGTQGNSFGLPTGSKRLVLVQGSTNYLYAYQFYDRFGRVIQARTNNHLSLAVDNLTTVIYDFEGKVLQTKTYHNAGGTNQATVVQKNTYDFAGRLTQVYHNINGAPTDQLVAQYSYNELGQMVDKQMHYTPPSGGAGGGFLQSVDLRYNIRGWLKSINNAQLTADGVMNDDSNDYFGMELAYHTDAGIGNTKYYNGNISATKWKTLGETVATAGQRSYKYSYDKSDKLKTATFQAFNNTTSTWTKEANTLNEQITHDHNGNILSLLRNSATPTAARTAQTMDNLTYTYGYGNRLNKVADTGLPTAGFVDDSNAQAKEYTYDSLGNLLTDKNKNISAIIYNTLGKPQQITYTNGNTVAYTYDAAGSKLKVVSTVGGTATTTDYVSGFVYTNTALTFFSSPEGRVVKNGSNFEYQYAISDHQGNTRVLFTSAAPTTQSVTATFEAANQTAEATQFSNYGHISAINNHTPGGANSQYLNGGYAGMVGVAKSFKVFPGDQLQIEAYGSYNAPGSNSSSLASFAGALLTAFNLTAPAGGETGTASSAINAWGGQEAAGYANGSTDNTNPKAFVNIVLFDKNYNLLDVAYAQLKGTSLYYMTASYTVREIGYAYLYVSNEQLNMTDVYFDDVKVSYTPSRLVQSNEYYPFGLQTANSWTRDGNIANNFLANGGTELNNTTALYDLEFRNYDPALGRMHQVDPMASKYSSASTYHYSFNNPVSFTDANGADPYHTGGVAPSHWSADMAEMSSGNVPHPAPGGFWAAYASGGGGTGFADNNMWDYVGHYNLDAGGYGFGDIYQSGRGSGYVGANRFMNEALQGNGGYWSNGSAHYYTSSELETRVNTIAVGYIRRMGMFNFISNQIKQLLSMPEMRVYFASLKFTAPERKDFPWIVAAIGEYGQKEDNPVDGASKGNNQRILAYFLATDLTPDGDSETAWCAAFANWCFQQAGIQGSLPNNGYSSSNGYSFMEWGKKLSQPAFGALGIYETGHVGFIVGIVGEYAIFLGGNQSDQVKVTSGYYKLENFKGWRYPDGFTPNYNLFRKP